MKLLIASLLLLSSPLYARITQSPDVSVTAAADDADNVAKTNSYIYYWDGSVNRRVLGNSSGAINVVTSGGGAASGVTVIAVASGVSISVNNSASNAVQVAGSITNTVAVTCAACSTSANQDLAFGSQTTTAAVLAGVATAANQALIYGAVSKTAETVSTAAHQVTLQTTQAGAAGSLTTLAAATINVNPASLSFGARVIGWVPLTQTAYTGLTTNANATLGITATAGSAAYSSYRVRVSAETGVTSLRFTQHNGSTVSTGFGASNGHQIFPSDRPQWLGPYTLNGSVPYFTLRASALSGATSGTAWIEIEGQP